MATSTILILLKQKRTSNRLGIQPFQAPFKTNTKKMKNHYFTLFVAVFAFSFSGFSQNKCIKVLFRQGNVSVVKDGKATTPKTGTSICGNFTIQLENGASIALIDENNQSTVLEKGGKFTSQQIEATFKNKSLKSVGKAYLDLIFEKLVNFNTEEDQYYRHHKRYFVDPAGVERGMLEKFLALPSKSKVLPGVVTIYTLSELNKSPATAKVFDFQTNSYSSSFKLDQEKKLSIKLLDNSGKETQFAVTVKSNQETYTGEVNYLLDVVKHPFLIYPGTDDDFSAMDWFGLGLAFEQNNYYVDALNCFIEAQKKKPEIEFYQENIVRLLNLIGFEKDDATALAKYWKYNLD